MNPLFLAIFLCLLMTIPQKGMANGYLKEFSAIMNLSNPKNPQQKIKTTLHVAKDRFRSEGIFDNKSNVLIVHTTERKMWTLFPDDKTYHIGPGKAPVPPKPDRESLPSDKESHCTKNPNISCSKVGTETIDGIKTEQWEVTITHKNRQKSVLLWVDPSRKIIIRQQSDKGPTLNRKLLSIEELNGRQTEKWLFSSQFQGQTKQYLEWVDVSLRIPIQKEVQKQIVRELTQIQEKTQPPSLFEIPKDYQQIPGPDQDLGQNQPPQRKSQPNRANSPANAPGLRYH